MLQSSPISIRGLPSPCPLARMARASALEYNLYPPMKNSPSNGFLVITLTGLQLPKSHLWLIFPPPTTFQSLHHTILSSHCSKKGKLNFWVFWALCGYELLRNIYWSSVHGEARVYCRRQGEGEPALPTAVERILARRLGDMGFRTALSNTAATSPMWLLSTCKVASPNRDLLEV